MRPSTVLTINGTSPTGKTTLVFVHNSCSRCEKFMESNQHLEIIYVEVPPVGQFEQNVPIERWFVLSNERDWFIETPSVLLLQDEKVLSVLD